MVCRYSAYYCRLFFFHNLATCCWLGKCDNHAHGSIFSCCSLSLFSLPPSLLLLVAPFYFLRYFLCYISVYSQENHFLGAFVRLLRGDNEWHWTETNIHHFVSLFIYHYSFIDSLAKYGRYSNYNNNNNMKWLSQIDRERKKNGSNEYAKKPTTVWKETFRLN